MPLTCGSKILADYVPPAWATAVKRAVDAGARALVMEVSSHALMQDRVAGLEYDVAVWTNLSRDHLDYHETMDAYFAAKMRLFDEVVVDGGTAVVTDYGARSGGNTLTVIDVPGAYAFEPTNKAEEVAVEMVR